MSLIILRTLPSIDKSRSNKAIYTIWIATKIKWLSSHNIIALLFETHDGEQLSNTMVYHLWKAYNKLGNKKIYIQNEN